MSNLFDPNSKIAGNLRALLAVLSAVSVGLTSLTGTYDSPQLAKVLVVVMAVVQFLTRFTAVGGSSS